jgi:Flp pilus assembly pilin Flp
VCIFQRLWRDQRGASLIDYAILAALITVLVVVGVDPVTEV